MKPLSICLVLFGLLALVQPAHQLDLPGALLGIVVLLCAATTFRSSDISSFLKIFVGIFSTETIVFGLAVLAGRTGLWPADYAEYLPPESLPLTVAIFSIIVYVVAQFGSFGFSVGEHGLAPSFVCCWQNAASAYDVHARWRRSRKDTEGFA